MSNRKKIYIITTTIFLVLGGLVWFWGQKTEEEIGKTIENQYGEMEMRMAENVATIMENMVSGLTSQLEIMAKIPAIRDASPENCDLSLEQFYNNFTPHVYNLVRANKDGIYVCSSLKELVGQNRAQFPHVAEILKTQKPVISRKFKSIIGGGEWLISIHVPVFTADGKFVGSLGSAIKLADIYENYLKNNVFAQKGYVVLIDDNGDYLYHPNPTIAVHNVHDEYMTKVLAESKAMQDLVKNYLAGKTGVTKYIYLKEWKLAAYTHAQITQDRFWPITITVPINEIQGPVKSAISRLQYLFFAVITLLALLSLGIIISFLRWGKILDIKIQARTRDLKNANIATLNVLEDLQAEKEELVKTKAKDEAIIASIGDGLVVVDKEGKILMVNNAFENLVGWKRKEVLGKLLVEVVPKEDEAGNVAPFKERILTKILSTTTTTTTTTTTVADWYYLRKDKTRFPVTSIITPFILEDKIIGAIEVFRDITKERAMDKAKTEFVSLASHQLRTPLTAISWYTEMILNGDVGQVIPEQKKYLEEIYEGDKRMIALVNTLLNVSRFELGTFKVENKLTDIIVLAKSVLDEQKSRIEKKKLIVKENFSSDIPTFSTDPKLMRIVFQNLLDNAVEYTPEKGTVRFEINLDSAKKNILITVADTGYGISQNQQDKIFTKFFRADNVREKDTDGTGLGLYIVKSIINQSDGKIWFKSPASSYVEGEDGKGTEFYVSLPLK